ncbi:MAG: AAA family ATPase [Candidatus Pacebacteria bacterium]|jgi:DNA polymerase-3 subunit delta'|nr:AAA family ATPase [Candidatus Paceibacterota bacterium]MDD5535271.1 AAA family ATPase [Candidatus Paceibacterota bacterium]
MAFFKNDGVTTFLEKFFDTDQRLVQNLLFWGEESTGKMTTARVFSEALLCSHNKKWERCNECSSCKMINQGYHPDLMIIEPEKNSVKIEQIKKGLEFLIYHPQISSLRILIIDKADKMTEDSQNALLKTLEESRDNILIILVTDAHKKLLSTIRSRLLSLRFIRATDKKIIDFLHKEYSLPQEEASLIAERAEGKIGKVIRLMDPDYKKVLDKKREYLIKILNQDFSKQSLYFKEITEDKKELSSTLEEWLRMLKSNKESSRLNLSLDKRTKLISSLLKAIYLITDTNINRQLLMENVFLQL